MPLRSCVFSVLNLLINFIYLCLLHALVPIGLINKYFHLFHNFYSSGKGGEKMFHFMSGGGGEGKNNSLPVCASSQLIRGGRI
jgi:hypothetical protein